MGQEFRAIDVDGHVNPSSDVVFRYADAKLRDRMNDLKPYIRLVKPPLGQGHPEDREEYSLPSIGRVRDDGVAGQ